MEKRLLSKKSRAEEFEEIASEHENRVYRMCYHMMGNQQDAMDCAQEAMLRAFRSFPSFRRESGAATWLTRIAMNVCVDELRKRKKVLSLDELREKSGFDVADAAPGAYARLEEKERIVILRESLQKLPDEVRQLIVLRDMEGMSYDEMAALLEIPLGTVKSRINRAREKLCKILNQSSELFSSRSV